MIPRPSRLVLAMALVLSLAGTLPAQRFGNTQSIFREPKTAAEFFDRIQYEIDVGNYSTAAQYLGGMLKLPLPKQELFELEKARGMTAFLKLRTIPRWVEVPPPTAPEAARKQAAALEAQARQDVEALLQKVTQAVRETLRDDDRLKRFAHNLTLGREEYDFAIGELYRTGPYAIPYIIDELRVADGDQRIALLKALRQLGPDIDPPIIAALDSGIASLQFDLIGVLRARGATESAPALYWVLGNTATAPAVREAARATLSYFTQTPPSRLPTPRAALTDEAERYYQHKVLFADPKNVVVWRWDPEGAGRVVQGFPDRPTLPATKAEEYYGTRYATQALALDPAYAPAQMVLASLILDKNYEETGPARPLSATRPAVHQRLSALNPDLMTSVLERGLRDRRMNVILGALYVLGDQGEVRANLPRDAVQPPLVRALNYPDPRVQLVAAETQLKIPGPPDAATAVRVVDVLKRAVAADTIDKATARILVGYFDEGHLAQVTATVRDMGYNPIGVRTGKAGVRRLQDAADVDAFVLDADLPDPGLAHVLAQLKADRNARALPVFVTAGPRNYDRWRLYLENHPTARLLPEAAAADVVALKDALLTALETPEHKPPTPEEVQDRVERAVRALGKLARREVPGYDVSPAGEAIFAVLRSGKLSAEGQIAAVAVVGAIPGSRSQQELLDLLVKPTPPKEVRIAAAETLVRHLQKNGLGLKPPQTEPVARLAADPMLDPALRTSVTALLGALNPTLRLSGERLQGYRPDLAPPAAPMPPPPMPDK